MKMGELAVVGAKKVPVVIERDKGSAINEPTWTEAFDPHLRRFDVQAINHESDGQNTLILHGLYIKKNVAHRFANLGKSMLNICFIIVNK